MTFKPVLIYEITCTANGKRYIGVTRKARVEDRLTRHFQDVRHPSAKTRPLMRAMMKYGRTCFSIRHVASARTDADAFATEIVLTLQEGTLSPAGYNASLGGRGGLLGVSAETAARLSASILLAQAKPEVKARISAGIKAAWAREDVQHRRRESLTATQATAEFKTRKSVSAKLSNADPQVRAKIAASLKAALATPEARAKRSAEAYVSQGTPEARARMKASHATPEFKAKHRAAMIKWAEQRRLNMRGPQAVFRRLELP